MRSAIAVIFAGLALAGLAGCDSQAEPNASPMLRYQVDSGRERSWWLMRDGVFLNGATQPKKVVALPGWLWVADPHCPPDLTLGPNGEAIVTSNVVPILWRIDPQTLAVSVHELKLDTDADRDVGFVAIAYSAEQAAFVAYSEGQRSVWKIDRQLTRATKLSDVDLSRMRSARSISVRGSCAEMRQRLARFAESTTSGD
jgi:hypothetical protein